MRALINSAVFAASAIAAPALAQDSGPTPFTGPRVEAHVGYDNVRIGSGFGHADGVTFGAGAGYDFALGGGGLIAGVEVNGDFSTTDKFGIDAKRDLDASARLGTVVGRGLLYAKVGYANARFGASGVGASNLDGVRAGVGYEMAFGGRTYGKVEYRYTNYEQGVSRNQAIAGVGIRF